MYDFWSLIDDTLFLKIVFLAAVQRTVRTGCTAPACKKFIAAPVNEGLILAFHHDPILGAFIPDGADLEAVEFCLRDDCSGINGIGQDVLDDAVSL